jgi:hypothetical protein
MRCGQRPSEKERIKPCAPMSPTSPDRRPRWCLPGAMRRLEQKERPPTACVEGRSESDALRLMAVLCNKHPCPYGFVRPPLTSCESVGLVNSSRPLRKGVYSFSDLFALSARQSFRLKLTRSCRPLRRRHSPPHGPENRRPQPEGCMRLPTTSRTSCSPSIQGGGSPWSEGVLFAAGSIDGERAKL